MNSRSQILLWCGLIVAIVFGVLIELFPLPDAGDRLATLSRSGPGYASRDVPVTSGEAQIFKQARVVKRLYQAGNQRFMLIVIDGGQNRHAVHDPLYCFRGAGWKIAGSDDLKHEIGNARLLLLYKNNQMREVLYWFSDGSYRHTSVMRYWMQTFLRRLSFGLSGREPVIVIMQSIGSDSLNWRKIIDQFEPLFEV